MNRGAFDFLTKPLNLQDLTITTNKTLQHVQQMKLMNRNAWHGKPVIDPSATRGHSASAVEEELRESEKTRSAHFWLCQWGVFVVMPMANPTTLIRLHNRYWQGNRSHSRSIKRNLSSLSGGDGAVVPHWAATHYPSIGWWKCHHRWYWDSPSRQCYPGGVNFFDDKGRIIYAFKTSANAKGRADSVYQGLAQKCCSRHIKPGAHLEQKSRSALKNCHKR